MTTTVTRKVGTLCGARCTEPNCGKKYSAPSADTWAANHAARTGHIVELRMGWLVKRAEA